MSLEKTGLQAPGPPLLSSWECACKGLRRDCLSSHLIPEKTLPRMTWNCFPRVHKGKACEMWELLPEVKMWGGLSLIQGVTYPWRASVSRKKLNRAADAQGLRKEPSAWNSCASTGSGHRACCLFPKGASFHHLPGPEGKTPPSQVQILLPCTSSPTALSPRDREQDSTG